MAPADELRARSPARLPRRANGLCLAEFVLSRRASGGAKLAIRERIGVGFRPADARQSLDLIRRAEAAGVETIWTVMNALGRDTPTIFAAAAVQTSRIKLGTAIVPAFTRHPLALATQALTLED